MMRISGISLLPVIFSNFFHFFLIFSILVDENPDFMQQKKYPNPQTSIARTLEQQRQTGAVTVEDNPERMILTIFS